MGKEFIDLTGRRFGKLTVVEKLPSGPNAQRWRCQCDCGSERIAPGRSLRHGKIFSCGCERGTHRHSVGHGKSLTYRSWDAMIARTTHPSSAGFAHYQRLGITVCDRWRHGDGTLSGFACFLADMGERPSKDHTLDRWPDMAGNYEPGNCRWATRQEQGNNRATNVTVAYKGQEYTMAELARATGLPKEFLRHRITRAGWSVEEAVEAPRQQGRRRDLV